MIYTSTYLVMDTLIIATKCTGHGGKDTKHDIWKTMLDMQADTSPAAVALLYAAHTKGLYHAVVNGEAEALTDDCVY